MTPGTISHTNLKEISHSPREALTKTDSREWHFSFFTIKRGYLSPWWLEITAAMGRGWQNSGG